VTDEADDVRAWLRAAVSEATELRTGASLPVPGAGLSEIAAGLLATRQRLDRVEELLAQALRVRGRIARHSLTMTAVADDAWDMAVRQIATAPSIRGPEFQGPRERYAEANLLILEHRRAARAADGLLSEASEAHDVLRLLHRGLDGLRQDHVTLLRAIQFATSLEH
jgi:hypothetical protein